jgi:hypothetical protein
MGLVLGHRLQKLCWESKRGRSVSGQLGQAIGAVCGTAGAAQRLHIPEPEVWRRVRAHQLLGCITSDGALVFPVFQFAEDGSPLAGLGSVLSTMAQGTADRWLVALWMCTPSDQLRGRRPYEALTQGYEKAVLRPAEQTDARWRY